MTAQPPRFLYFDLGNVLIHFDHDRMCRQMAEVAGTDAATVRQVLLDSPLGHMIETGEVDTRQWYEAFCKATATRADFAALMTAASDIFWPNLEIVPVITQLAGANWPLGILSNTCQVHWDFLAHGRYGIVPSLFDPVVLSFQVHHVKPEEDIYRHAAAQVGCRPEEIFYTDDRPENVAGARRVGMDAVLFTTVRELVEALRARGVTFNY